MNSASGKVKERISSLMGIFTMEIGRRARSMAMELIHMQMVKGMVTSLGDGNIARRVLWVEFLPGFIFTSGTTVSNA